MANSLASETSPYLLQHADNPVEWHAWGEEAFARAREEDKPILVSIGYSACHWCHVMEHESFEDPEIARQMNEAFVCVKVDREERPDVDAIYMEAVQAMTGRGGWPLNAFCTPDRVPFWAGTYFPPDARQGLPGWPQVLSAIADAWANRRAEIDEGAGRIVPRLQGAAHLRPAPGDLAAETLEQAVARLRETYDAEHGGWGGAPKFPAASVIELLLGQGEREMALHTLRAMANGGMYDQIGGGFARYSVDAQWVIPHFEKMLYDNALLARAYLHGWLATGRQDGLLRRVCEETCDWMLRELRQEEGGFASALDADADGVEGSFTVWTPDQMREVLGPELGEVAIRMYGLDRPPNFEGAWNPVRAAADPPERDEIRARLYEARARRVWPGLDDKRLTAWNALAISALAEAGAVLGRADYLDAARECAEFVLRDLRREDGTLLRTYNRGEAKIPAFLEDHAFLLEALLTLYEASFEPQWFTEAEALAAVIVESFGDREHGGFFSTAAGSGLIARRKDLEDAPIPSGASSAALGMLRLSALSGDATWAEAALGHLRLLHVVAPQHPQAFGHLLQAIAFAVGPVREVALVGDDLAQLASTVRSELRPRLVLAGGAGGSAEPPLLEGREPVDGMPAAYVCEGFACQRPVTSPTELAALLEV